MNVVVGLGANLGDRLVTLRDAAARIAEAAPILARSRVYETAPVGGPPQGRFLNAAVRVAWTDPAEDLLDRLLAIELELGRVRGVRNGPRTIDLDVLWIEGQILASPRVVVPHPRLHERAFAVGPLLDVMPAAVDPRTGTTYVIPAGDPLVVFAPSI